MDHDSVMVHLREMAHVKAAPPKMNVFYIHMAYLCKDTRSSLPKRDENPNLWRDIICNAN